ncbi:hypothetical protein BH24ACT5_BH24ACT5_08930 [soil metagenome]
MPLADVLRAQMDRPPRYSPGLVSRLSGVPKATIVNWLEGRVARPRRWQDLVRVADAMRLGRDEAEALLGAAHHPSLTELARGADDRDRALLGPWLPSMSFDPAASVPLPTIATPLVGRTVEHAALSKLVCDANVRVVTMTGPGGAGKTRLAIAVASAVSNGFRDGVAYVALAPLTDAAFVEEIMVRALGVGAGTETMIRDALASRHQLVVLDNFEHLLDALPAVAELITNAPDITFLVTSRTVLHLYGEHRFEVAPLPVPDDRDMILDEVAASPAFALFAQRAQAADPSFQLDPDNIRAVAEICRQLDGLPLAIELAAARITVLQPDGLLSRLARSLGLLTWGARDLPARHQSLRATLDWSLDQVTARTRRLFAHLSVYMSGCRLDGAEAVGHPLDSDEVLDGLMDLVDHSLLRTLSRRGESRFVMLETVRSYAESLLTDDESEHAHRRALVHVIELGNAVESEARGSRQGDWLDRAGEELENIRALLRWSLDHDEVTAAATIATSLLPFWLRRGPLPEGQRWVDLSLRKAERLSPALRATTLYAAGRIARQLGDVTVAEQRLRESLDVFDGLPDPLGRAQAVGELGIVAADCGDLQRSADLHRESLAIYRRLEDGAGMALALTNLGEVARQQRHAKDAVSLHDQSASLFAVVGDAIGEAAALTNLATSQLELGAVNEAQATLVRAARLWQGAGERSDLALCLELFTALAVDRQQHAHGVRLAAAAASLRQASGTTRSPGDGQRHRVDVDALRRSMDPTQFNLAWQDGWALDADDAMNLALAGDRRPTGPIVELDGRA